MRFLVHATRKGLVLAALLTSASGVLAARSLAQSTPPSSPAPDCSQLPLPAGCVTAIAYANPASIVATRDAKGVTRVVWSTDGGAVEQLPQAVTVDAARTKALGEVAARGLNRLPATVSAATARRRARTAQFSSYCSYAAYPPYRVVLDSYWSHVHAQADQWCSGNNMSSNGILTILYRDGATNIASSTDGSPGGGYSLTDAYGSCHEAGNHTWTNWSDFFGTSVFGVFLQGPAGFFAAASYRCY